MKVAARLFLGAGVFFAVIFAIYWLTSYEPAGSVLLFLAVPSCLMIGGWIWLHLRRHGGLPEDDMNSSPGDNAGPLVAVPAGSLWPVGLAFGAGTFAAGLVLGPWLALPGAIVLVLSVIGIALKGRDYPA